MKHILMVLTSHDRLGDTGQAEQAGFHVLLRGQRAQQVVLLEDESQPPPQRP